MTQRAHLHHSEPVPECVWCLMENSEEARQAVWDTARHLRQAFEETAEQAQKLTVILVKMGEQIDAGTGQEESGELRPTSGAESG